MSYKDEVRQIIASIENEPNDQQPPEDIQDVYVLIVREHEEPPDNIQVVESEPPVPTQPAPVSTSNVPTASQLQKVSFLPAYTECSLFLLLIFSAIAFQLYCLFNPAIATITIIPRSHTVTLNGTVQLGRVLNPLTISQSQTTPATGHGHQDARAATGYLTFYNGLSLQQTVLAGTILTGRDGIQIATDQDVTIPAADTTTTPPTDGYVTVSAHAVQTGMKGNIAAYDISDVYSSSITVKNLNAFRGGQDERTFTTVTQNDIHKVSTLLKTTLAASMHGALEGQVTQSEQFYALPCNPDVSSDHPVGAEATTVTVTVSLTCSAIAYSSQELQTKATAFLATQAQHKTGVGYSLFGTVQVQVTQASISSTTPHLVFLTFHTRGTWIYGISARAQESIKNLIAGKTTLEAENILAALPGVASASIRFSGFGDEARIPKNSRYIHLSLIVV